MAKYDVPDKYQLMVCPYNKEHLVDAYRFSRHLEKCKKVYTGVEVERCPFNHIHVIEKSQMRQHMATCPFKVRLEQALAPRPTPVRYVPLEDTPPVQHWQTEDWEADLVQPGILQRLNAAEIKPLAPKVPSHQGPTKDINKWLSGASPYEDIHPDEEWEPPSETGPNGERGLLRQPKSKPKATEKSKRPGNPLALAGIGRGRAILRKNEERNENDCTQPPGSSTSSSTVSHGPIGRGRGLALRLDHQRVICQTGGSCGDSDSRSGEEDAGQDRRAKDIRKFQKKLQEVASLREDLDRGVELNADQLRKLQLENMYKKKLANLGCEL